MSTVLHEDPDYSYMYGGAPAWAFDAGWDEPEASLYPRPGRAKASLFSRWSRSVDIVASIVIVAVSAAAVFGAVTAVGRLSRSKTKLNLTTARLVMTSDRLRGTEAKLESTSDQLGQARSTIVGL